MTFEKWWRQNSVFIWRQGGLASPTIIRSLFEEAWVDGFRIGFQSPNKPVEPTASRPCRCDPFIAHYKDCPKHGWE